MFLAPTYYELFFWVSVLLVCYVYFGYPLLLGVLTLFFGSNPRRDDAHTPSVSLMILAYNEEESLAMRLENAFKMDYPSQMLEVMVVSNGSTDRTDEIAKGYEDRGVKLLSYKEPGKTRAQNLAVPHAKGDIVIFSDADTFYKKDAIRKLVAYFSDKKTGLVCGRVGHVETVESADLMVEKGEKLYRGYDNILKILESKLGSCLVASGCIIAFRKDCYETIDENLTEDFVLPIRMLKNGYRNVFAPEAVAMEKVAEQGREEFGRKERTIIQGSRALFSMLAELPISRAFVIFELVSHKLLRWLVGGFLLIAFFSNAMLLSESLYRVFFAVQAAFYTAALVGYILERSKIRVKALYIPYFFCLVNVAAIMALIKMSMGRKLPSWRKAEGTSIGSE